VNISGVNLLGYGSNITSVTFGSQLADVISFTNSTIAVRITSHHNNTDTDAVNVTIVSDTYAIVSSAPNVWSFLVEGQVTAVTPAEGHIGTFVTLTGNTLLGGGNITSVYLDGVSTEILSVSNNTVYLRLGTNTQRRSGYTPGEVIISIDTGAVVLSAANVNFTFRQTGLITGFSPLIGREGTYVTITGTNMLALGSKIIRVSIAGFDVPQDSIQYNGSDVNRIVVRAGQSNTSVIGNIQLFIDTGTIVLSHTTYNFSYVSPGVVTSVSPSEGVEGTGVLIEGQDLYVANSFVISVHLAGSPVTRVVVATRAAIAVVAGPPMTNATGLLITASDGSITRGGPFVYGTPHYLVLRGPSYGQHGTRVTIDLPVNFEVLFVLVDTIPALVITRDVSSCVISIPRAQRQGTYYADIVIKNTKGEVLKLADRFMYMPEGVITKVSPKSGQLGTIVTITGNRLLGGGSFIKHAELAGIDAYVISSSNLSVVVEIACNNRDTIPTTGDVVLTADTGANVTQLRAWTTVVPAMITAVEPSNGQYGTFVNITGSNLLQGEGLSIRNILLAGVRVDNIVHASSTQIQIRAPKALANVTGVVRIELGTGAYYESVINWTFVSPIVINSITPSIGAIGSIVSLQFGSVSGNITEEIVVVMFDGIQAQITREPSEDRSNTLDIIVRPGKYSNPVSISVETASGQLLSLEDIFTVEEKGEVLSVSPSIIQQGIIVNIMGYNFLGRSGYTAVDSVWLAGIKVNRIISQDNISVAVEAGYAPETVVGNVTIGLNTAARFSSNSDRTIVQYYQSIITNITPRSGYNGTRFTISGVGLVYPNNTLEAVLIGNISATIEDYNNSVILARAGEPYSDVININMTIRVVSSTGAYIEMLDSWRYLGMPLIAGVDPNIASGGDIVTIFGTDLIADNVSEVLIGGMVAQELLFINTSNLRVRLPYGINSSELQTVEITATDGSTITSAPLFMYRPISYSIVQVVPAAGQNGTQVNIKFNTVPPNITMVYLGEIMVRKISVRLNKVIVVAGYGDNVTGDTVIHTATGLILGRPNSWSYLPLLNSSHVSPQYGQEVTLVTILVGPYVLSKYQIEAVTLAGVAAAIQSVGDDSVVVQAGVSPPTDVSDIVLHFEGEIRSSIPLSWTYLPPIAVVRLSNTMGYFNNIITIHGTNFLNGQPDIVNITKVTLAGVTVPTITFFNDTLISCKITQFINSSFAPIVGPVTVQNSLGFIANTSGMVDFTYVQVMVLSISPSQGQNGTIVIIEGVGLLAGAANITSVWLNNVPVNDIINATNSIITVQAGYSNTSTPVGDVTYHTNSGAIVTAPAKWHYVAPGVITSVTPCSGTEGTVVTIEGKNLFTEADSIDAVYLDGVKVSKVIMAFNTYVQVVAAASPSFSTTFGPVSISLSSGAWVSSERRFKYRQPGIISNVTPLQGQNGTVVNITGTSLYYAEDSIVDVKLAGISAILVYISNSFIQVAANRPSKLESFSGPISIYTASGAVLSYTSFTYLQEGFIASVTPSQGQIGAIVEIKGRGLFGGGERLLGIWLAGIPAVIQPIPTDDCIIVTAEHNNASSTTPVRGDVLIVSITGAHVRRINGWTYVKNGRIDSISPAFGQYGTRINISGEALLLGAVSLSHVTIGGILVNVTEASNTLISGTAGNPLSNSSFAGTISIMSSDGSILITNHTWAYADQGVIHQFTPITGSNSEIIRITGTNLLGSGRKIVKVTTAGIEVSEIVFQNNTLVVVRSGILKVAQTLTGPIVLTADTGAIVESVNPYTFIKPCNVDQYILNNDSGLIDCGNCSDVCASCSGPTDSDCTQCRTTSYLVQMFSNSSKQCTKQCMNFSNDKRQCVESCTAGQYLDHFDTERTTFCRNCSDMCAINTGCSGPAPTQCSHCKHVRYQMECVAECPANTFVNHFNTCILCHGLCDHSAGCTGPTASECMSCANLTVRGETANGLCVEQCPHNYYSNDGACLQCDPLCLAGCTGSGPMYCDECLFAGVKHSDGSIECVEECDSSTYYLNSSTSLCEQCSDMCSSLDGCDGPSSTDCRSCRMPNSSMPGTFKFNDMCILECNLMSNNTVKYYNDPVTQGCQQCHVSCSKGCSGSGPSNCFAESSKSSSSENFEAGVGVISIVIIVCVLLLMLIMMCAVILIRKRMRDKRQHHCPQIPNVLSNTETTDCSQMEDVVYEDLDMIRGASVANPVPISSE